MVFLGFRPQAGRFHHLGRETFLAPVTWSADGWPVVNENGDVVWVCGNANDPLNTYVNSAGALGTGVDSPDGVTDLSDKHVPASCRTDFGGS